MVKRLDLKSGPIAWMARHGIAPNLLMLALLIGGLMTSMTIKKEFLPAFTLDMVQVRLVYAGATPAEMEQGVVLPVENVLSELEGIDDVSVSILEGYATVTAEIESGQDLQQMYQDILQAVNRITTFPAQMDQPIVSVAGRQHEIMELMLYGNLQPFEMKRLAETVKTRLLESPFVTQIDMAGAPAEEIHVEVSRYDLDRYDLTLEQVANVIRLNAVEKSAGTVKTDGGDILVTLNDRKYWAGEFSNLPLVSNDNGVVLTLGEVARISEGFEDSNDLVTLDAKESIRFMVYRSGDQTPTTVADSIYAMWPDLEALLPEGMFLSVVDDKAEMYRQRLGLLLKNAFIGLALVLILLSVFLEYRLAFWVTMGIPTSFLGAMLFLPIFGVSINMVSMFAFIIALGIVVDDAIIAGENIYANLAKGMSRTEAAIHGAKEVAIPLSFSILTNIVAFMPLFFMPGGMGQVMLAIPAVVVMCFAISWVEALFILPAHIAHLKDRPSNRLGQKLDDVQERMDGRLKHMIHNRYRPLLTKALDNPGVTIAVALAVTMMVMAYPISGRMGFSPFPVLEGDAAVLEIEMPPEASLKEAKRARDAGEQALANIMLEIEAQHGPYLKYVKSEIQGTAIEVEARLKDGERPIKTHEVVSLWRAELGEMAGVKSITFDAERGAGPASGRPFTLELKSTNSEELAAASKEMESILKSLSSVKDVANSLAGGKPQWNIELNDKGRALGLSASDVADQVRNNLYGARALRQQREKNEVTVLVRLPQSERRYQSDIQHLWIVTPQGNRVPLGDIANLHKSQAPGKILRKNGAQLVTLGAAVEPRSMVPNLQKTLESEHFPAFEAKYPNVSYRYGGRQADANESFSSLLQGFVFTLLGIYIMLAIPFKSYKQPLLIMAVIPFGIVGAILGLMLLGQSLSIIAIMGMLALCGVVVNDSLILIDYANALRAQGVDVRQAILDAAERRFRPIMLTTLTTFGGLAPMVFETSRQAQFITPMAVSLGFGILFTTFVCLLVLPCLYLLMERSSKTSLLTSANPQ